MGWFDDKVVTVRGVKFPTLAKDTREEFILFKKELLEAMISNFDLRSYAFEIWKYKKEVRSRYNTNKINALYGGDSTKTFTKLDHTSSLNYLLNHGVTNAVRILSVADRTRVNSSDVNDGLSNAAYNSLVNMTWSDSQPTYSSYDIPAGDESGEYDRYYPYSVRTGGYLIDNGIGGSVSIRHNYNKIANVEEYRYTTPASAGTTRFTSVVATRVDTLSTTLFLYSDVKEYYYGTATFLSTGSNHGALPVSTSYIPIYIANAAPVVNTSTITIAPMLQVKSLTNTVTDNDKDIIKQIETMGINLESIQFLLDGNTVKDCKVGLMVSPHDALTSKSVAKYLFNYFDMLGIGSTSEYSDILMENKDGFEFTQNVGNSSYVASFSATKSIVAGTIPNSSQTMYKLKCKQNIPNSQKFYKVIKEAYDKVLSNDVGNTKTSKQLYSEIIAALSANPTNQGLLEAKAQLPSARGTQDIYPIKYIILTCNTGDQAAESLKERSYALNLGDDDTLTEIYDIVLAQELSDFPNSDKYSAVASVGYEYNEHYPDYLIEGDGFGGVAIHQGHPLTVYTIMIHYQHSPTHYTTITYANGKSVYVTASGTVVQRHTATETDFRLPMLKDALQHITTTEFHELYSKCLVGLVFTVDTFTIKWYQRSTFRTLLQIVMVVITIVLVYYGGAEGGTVSSFLWSIAIATAVGQLLPKVLEKLGIDEKWAGVITVILSMVISGNVDSSGLIALGFAAADAAIQSELQTVQEDIRRLQEEQVAFKKMFDKKVKELQERLGTYSNSNIFNIVKSSPEYEEYRLYTPSYAIEYQEYMGDVQKESEWKVPEIGEATYELLDSLGQNRFRTDSQFEMNLRIGEIHTFGV